jgi:hypothetical protein
MEEMVRLESSITIICHMLGDDMIKSLHKQQTLDSVRGMCQSPVRLQVEKISMSNSGGKEEKLGELRVSSTVDMIMVLWVHNIR